MCDNRIKNEVGPGVISFYFTLKDIWRGLLVDKEKGDECEDEWQRNQGMSGKSIGKQKRTGRWERRRMTENWSGRERRDTRKKNACSLRNNIWNPVFMCVP